MAITILHPPTAAAIAQQDAASDDDEWYDSEGDADMEGLSRGTKRPRISRKAIVTPGELVTDDPQWMRYEGLSTKLELDFFNQD